MLTVKDICKDLGVCPATVHKYIKDGKLKAFKPNKYWRIREEEYRKFLKEGNDANI